VREPDNHSALGVSKSSCSSWGTETGETCRREASLLKWPSIAHSNTGSRTNGYASSALAESWFPCVHSTQSAGGGGGSNGKTAGLRWTEAALPAALPKDGTGCRDAAKVCRGMGSREVRRILMAAASAPVGGTRGFMAVPLHIGV